MPTTPPMRVAVVDLGTFSATILIAEERRGALVMICEERETIDLAYERGRVIPPKAIARASKALRRFEKLVYEHESQRALILGTAALRHASNKFSVVRELRTATQLLIRVLTDKQEAQFAARGALIGLPKAPKETLVIDLGGGSTEFIQTSTNAFRGLPIGAAWATDKWKEDCPRDRGKRDEYYAECARKVMMDLDTRSFTKGSHIVGLGGTITSLAAMHKKLKKFDAEAVHGSELTSEWIAEVASELSTLPEKSIKAKVPFDPSCARVLTAGTYLWSGVLNRLSAGRVVVSARGLRWGAAAHLAGLS